MSRLKTYNSRHRLARAAHLNHLYDRYLITILENYDTQRGFDRQTRHGFKATFLVAGVSL